MQYSTTKAIVNLVRPGTFVNPPAPTAGLGRAGLGTAISFSTNMMLGLAVGAVGVIVWCKNQHKIRGSAA